MNHIKTPKIEIKKENKIKTTLIKKKKTIVAINNIK